GGRPRGWWGGVQGDDPPVGAGRNGAAGGLVGLNGGLIWKSSQTANVMGAAGSDGANTFVGGLVGVNLGLIRRSFASGDVGGNVDHLEAGGLVAFNGGTIRLSHAS